MSFFELVKKRYSVRRYSGEPVAREKIERCLEAARLAPSACNGQPWQFIVVDEPELKEKGRATFGPFQFKLAAPALVGLFLSARTSWRSAVFWKRSST